MDYGPRTEVPLTLTLTLTLTTIPKGLHLSAQGCEERATLGFQAKPFQPQRGCIKSAKSAEALLPLLKEPHHRISMLQHLPFAPEIRNTQRIALRMSQHKRTARSQHPR